MYTPKVSLNSRYLKARLKRFTRPLFLSSLGVISFLSFSVWEYSRNPQGRSASLDLANAPLTTEAGFSELGIQQSDNVELVNYQQQPLNINSPRGLLQQWLEEKRADSSKSFSRSFSSTNITEVATSRTQYSPEEVLEQPKVKEYRSILNKPESNITENTEQSSVTSTPVANRFSHSTVLETAMLRSKEQNQPLDNLIAQNVPTGPSGFTWGVIPRASGVNPGGSTSSSNSESQTTETEQFNEGTTLVPEQTQSGGGFDYRPTVGTTPISQPVIPGVSPNVPNYNYPYGGSTYP